MLNPSAVDHYTKELRAKGIEPFINIELEKSAEQKQRDFEQIQEAEKMLALDYRLFHAAANDAGYSPDEFYRKNIAIIENATKKPSSVFVTLDAYHYVCKDAFQNLSNYQACQRALKNAESALAQRKYRSRMILAFAVIVVVLVIAVAFGIQYANDNVDLTPPSKTQQATSPAKSQAPPTKPQTTSPVTNPDANLEKKSLYNGMSVTTPVGVAVAPLTIETKGSLNYYVVLVDKSNNGRNNMSFCVTGGSTVEKLVPLGNYEIYYATGSTWYGKDHLFGSNTKRYKCDDTFRFYEDSDSYMGWTLELYEQSNGNLDTDPVSNSDFPNV